MTTISIFAESGWDYVYRIRAAVNRDDVVEFAALTRELSYDASVQVTMIGETLLRQALGSDPPAATLDGAATTITPHLQRFMGSADIGSQHAAQLIRTGLRLRECPPWASRSQTMMFFCAFLAPVDDADFLDFRLRSEPLWVKAVEEHVR